MFNLLPRFIQGTETWTNGYNEAYNLFNNLDAYRRQFARISKTSSKRILDTIQDPLMDILDIMMAQDSEIPATTPIYLKHEVLRIREYDIKDLKKHTSPWPMNELDNPLINIIEVTSGGSFIPRIAAEDAVELKPLSVALQQDRYHRIRVFKRNARRYDVYTSHWNWELAHKIIAIFPALLPEIYTKISDETKACMLAMGESNINNFNEAFTRWENRTKFAKRLDEAALMKCFSPNVEQQMQDCRSRIETLNREIESYFSNINNKYTEIQTKNTTLLGLMNYTPSEELKDIVDYIFANKCIRSYHCNTDYRTIVIEFEASLKYVDVDVLKHNYINKRTKYDSRKEAIQLFEDCYINETHEIMVQSKLKLRAAAGEVVILTDLDERNSNAILQPHLQQFQCWGNNKAPIVRALRNQDPITAIEQCIATTMNLNFTDGTVVGSFMSRMYDTPVRRHIKFIKVLETGEMITFMEYMNRLEKNDPTGKQTKANENIAVNSLVEEPETLPLTAEDLAEEEMPTLHPVDDPFTF